LDVVYAVFIVFQIYITAPKGIFSKKREKFFEKKSGKGKMGRSTGGYINGMNGFKPFQAVIFFQINCRGARPCALSANHPKRGNVFHVA
jgi:hypothetical protein